MRVVLVGADFEENLGVGMIAACAARAGHAVEVVAFNEASETAELAHAVARHQPEVVGLSMQFQHRAHEFIALAAKLRAAGFAGHITCGGQYPTLADAALLTHTSAIDSVVLHEGERTFVELLDALRQGGALGDVAGLALRDERGAAYRTTARCLVDDLDSLPQPLRYRPHSLHAGVSFIPIMGSRGCWGNCTFCSITSFYRDARAQAPRSKMLRYRSPQNIADEMAQLWRDAEGRAVFCFHDDTFLLPRPQASLERVRAIRGALDERGVGRVGLVGKCRPDSLTPELARELRALGVVRLYVGVENVSERGAANLRRGMQTRAVREALAACREAGIFCCYNMLLFEPDARLEDIEDNLAFMREHAVHPVNFGRVEAYYGTPIHHQLAGDANLTGSFLGHGYRIADDKVELLFRIGAAIFRQRNYDCAGVHNRAMGLGYVSTLLQDFYADDPPGRRDELSEAACALTREIVLESADVLEQALELAREADMTRPGERERVERATAELGLRVAAFDRVRHAQLDALYGEMDAFTRQAREAASTPRRSALRRVAGRIARGVAVGSLLAGLAGGCDDKPTTIDPDVGPIDRGFESVDPDVGPLDQQLLDIDPDVGPLDRGIDADGSDGGGDGAGDGADGGADANDGSVGDASSLIDQWRDSAPRNATRSDDLPLFDPPDVRLSVLESSPGGAVEIALVGGPRHVLTTWQGDGALHGGARRVTWRPSSPEDQLRVAVRSAGGVTVAALRAREV